MNMIGRSQFRKLAYMLYSDGVPEIPVNKEVAKRLTLQEADLARAQDIEIFAIGIGEQITQEVLQGIANQPPSRHVFRVDQFQELEFILQPVARAAGVVAPGKIYGNYTISTVE